MLQIEHIIFLAFLEEYYFNKVIRAMFIQDYDL